jgi:hypothetical protein
MGYISRRTAEEVYGAVVSERMRKIGAPRYTVDPAASARKRARMQGVREESAAAG